MYDRPTDKVRPGQFPSAREYNRALDRLDNSTDIGGEGGVISDEMGGLLVTPSDKLRIRIRILSGSNPYAFEQVTQLDDGSYEAGGSYVGTVDADGAYEANGATDVPAGFVAIAELETVQDSGVSRWLFDGPGGSAPAGIPEADFAVDGLAANYDNGSSGVGATLTATANGRLVVDGVLASVDDLILVKPASFAPLRNGLYVVTQQGDASNPWILTRHTSNDTSASFDRAVYFVKFGAAFAQTAWMYTGPVSPVIGTTHLLIGEVPQPSDLIFAASITRSQQLHAGGAWEYVWAELPQGQGGTGRGRVGYFTPQLDVTVLQAGDGSHPEIQFVAVKGPPFGSGTWTVGGAAGLAFNITNSALQTALRASLGVLVTVTGSMTGGFTVTWPSNGAQSLLTGNISGLVPTSGSTSAAYELNNREVATPRNVWIHASGVVIASVMIDVDGSAVYSLSIIAESGRYKLIVDSVESAFIIYGATAATVKAAIEATAGLTLSSFSGSGTVADPWTFTVVSPGGAHTITVGDTSVLVSSGHYWFENWATDISGSVAGITFSDGVATAIPTNLTYSPSTPASWNGTAPTTITAALDRLAALVKTLNGGTGP